MTYGFLLAQRYP